MLPEGGKALLIQALAGYQQTRQRMKNSDTEDLWGFINEEFEKLVPCEFERLNISNHSHTNASCHDVIKTC